MYKSWLYAWNIFLCQIVMLLWFSLILRTTFVSVKYKVIVKKVPHWATNPVVCLKPLVEFLVSYLNCPTSLCYEFDAHILWTVLYIQLSLVVSEFDAHILWTVLYIQLSLVVSSRLQLHLLVWSLEVYHCVTCSNADFTDTNNL